MLIDQFRVTQESNRLQQLAREIVAGIDEGRNLLNDKKLTRWYDITKEGPFHTSSYIAKLRELREKYKNLERPLSLLEFLAATGYKSVNVFEAINDIKRFPQLWEGLDNDDRYGLIMSLLKSIGTYDGEALELEISIKIEP